MPRDPRREKTLLIVSQVFVPDPASVGQHVADVAVEMARRGHPVHVLTSARGYENPQQKYPPRETMQGVEIRRIPLASFGKRSIPLRVLGTAAFMTQILFRALFTQNLGGIFFSTSPPLVGLVGTIVAMIRRVPCAYWAMDLNPDQLIALGKIGERSFVAWLLESVNRWILRRSDLIIALDRFMAERLERRDPELRAKMLVLPPWPHEEHISQTEETSTATNGDVNPFRERHRLGGAFVVMYSGNHSPSNPLDTLLEAAKELRNAPDFRFLFVGGGSGKKDVEAFIREHDLPLVMSLPYQPLSELKHSLGAADVHVVSLGQEMVGIIHPCKIYGAMAAARPVLFLGPKPSHISDLMETHRLGWHVSHGDVSGAVAALREMSEMGRDELVAMGHRARAALQRDMGQQRLCRAMCDRVEGTIFSSERGAQASCAPGAG
ncbi:MAG: glycosyltransferase family 4 protein [Planctomycetota bacterium]|nr:glycosyltransferase family 4 protein [Planctomycetota bacterium]